MLPDVLTVNAGSTSVKLTRRRNGRDVPAPADLDTALVEEQPAVVVYRVVHGGHRTEPEILDDAAVADLRALTDLAPLHQPAALEGIDRCRAQWPDATHVACFDTTFHRSMPAEARVYALPDRLRQRVQVYGFHGLSHAWASSQVRATYADARRVLVAHLGGGQSLCGVLDGRSVVTTMGFTPLDGLVMATRSGTLDSSALLHLARQTDEDLDTVLETESGLLGLAGTADMREVLSRRAAGDASAAFALDVWLHHFLRHAGGVAAVLGGLDVLVFTGGIGENSGEIRSLVADRLGWLGVAVDERGGGDAGVSDGGARDVSGGGARDVSGGGVRDVSAAGAAARTVVVHAREDLQMLADAERLLAGSAAGLSSKPARGGA